MQYIQCIYCVYIIQSRAVTYYNTLIHKLTLYLYEMECNLYAACT